MAIADYSYLPFGAGGIPANENSGTSVAAPRTYLGTAAPTVGNYNQGDVIVNATPAASSPFARMTMGWLCTTGGVAGSTAVFTVMYSSALQITTTTTATSGTLTGGYRLTLLNPATTGTYSLPDASANLAGYEATFKSLASGSITLTPIASNGYADAAAITLAQFASVTLLANGSTTWFRQQ